LPVITVQRLYDLSYKFLEKAGAPPAIAQRVAHALVLTNIKGVDSHGVIRLTRYLEHIRQGLVVPDALPEVVQQTANTAVVDGHRAFGHVVAKFAMELAIDKARSCDVTAVTLHNTRHIGRVGEYVEMAVEAGFMGLAFCNSIPSVAPYGGQARSLGTNPIAIGIPSDSPIPFVLDFATSVVAEGKIRLARDKGINLPPGTILDAEGHPSVRPEDFYSGGALLPLGTYKGYGLSLAVEIMGALLAGSGASLLDQPAEGNGALLIVLNPARFCDPVLLRQQTQALCEAMKKVPVQEGFAEILVPGEPEYRAECQRRKEGIPLAKDTWQHLLEAGISIGMTADDFQLTTEEL